MKYSLYKIADKVYSLEIDNQYDLCMSFLKAQEFYESACTKFRGKKFTLIQYMDWYAKNQSFINCFSYTKDYCGFNLPGKSINDCYKVNSERTAYDNFLIEIHNAICVDLNNNTSDYYLIGITADSKKFSFNHEMAHAMYCLIPEYKKQMNKLVNAFEFKKDFFVILKKFGYASPMYKDEAQAYLSTGLMAEMTVFKEYQENFKEIFNQYKPDFVYEKSKKILTGKYNFLLQPQKIIS